MWHEVLIWGDLNVNLLRKSPSSCLLKEYCQDLHLHLVFDSPTRITESSASLIDIFLTSNPNSITSSGTLPLSCSDHQLLYATFKPKFKRSTNNSQKTAAVHRSMRNLNKNAFQEDLNEIPWQITDLFDDNEDKIFAWNHLLLGVLNQHTPLRAMRPSKHKCPWVTYDICQAIKKRNRIHKRFLRHRTLEVWNEYKEQRNLVVTKLRTSKKEYLTNLIKNNANPSTIWKVLKSSYDSNTKILPSSAISEPTETASKFNDHFRSTHNSTPSD